MDDPLDDLLKVKSEGKYSKISLATSFITIILSIMIFRYMPEKVSPTQGFPAPPIPLIITTQLSCLMGLIFAFLSIREHSSWKKWIGGTLNILIFLIFIGLIIFARTI